MRTPKAHWGWLMGLVALLALAGPAGAEVKVYLLDQTKPIVTAEVFEEGPWLFYREGESPYLFSIARNRVERLEIVRAGAVQTVQITPAGQEVFPDSRRQVFFAITDLRDKRAEELAKKLQDEVGALARAASAATGTKEAAGGTAAGEALAALALQRDRVNKVIGELSQVTRELDRSLDQMGKYRPAGLEPRYYFHR